MFFCLQKKSVQTQQLTYLKAIVVSTRDISCGQPVLDFSEDSMAIEEITKQKWKIIVARDLSPQLNIQNKKLFVAVSMLKPGEAYPCLAIGISYPQVKVVDAKER